MTRRHFFLLLFGAVVVVFCKNELLKCEPRLVWGDGSITYGDESFRTVAQAYNRAFFLYGDTVDIPFGLDVVRALRERGEFHWRGWWMRLEGVSLQDRLSSPYISR